MLDHLHKDGLGYGLRRVLWTPNPLAGAEARVEGDVILVYSADVEGARRATIHEVIHWEIARCTTPFMNTINALLREINEQGYRRAERLTNVFESHLSIGTVSLASAAAAEPGPSGRRGR